jgi:DNA replication protein DnaD
MQVDTIDEYLTYWRYVSIKSGSILWEKFFNKMFYTVPLNSEIIVSYWGKEFNIDETKNLVNTALKICLERIN